ncbi:MAG: flagellar hook-length control protein FliK, partial [Planctomycetota bacterium]|nr:flagellar hook-length control protein FliK [Planctomycetota bacterium]
AVEALAEGDAREAGRSALRGLEADRLLALLRQHAEGELRTALPFPDGADLALLHLFVRPDHRGGASTDAEGDAAPEPGWRVRLGLDLARLGPVRLDLLWRRDRLLLSLSCATPETLERLRAGVGELEEQLAAEGQEVEVVLALASAESLDLAPESRRVPKPTGDSWMDIAG